MSQRTREGVANWAYGAGGVFREPKTSSNGAIVWYQASVVDEVREGGRARPQGLLTRLLGLPGL